MLVTISISFAVRYIVRTGLLDMLRAFSEPVVAITWDQEDLVAELRARGFEVHIVPADRRDSAYADTRKKIDIWFEYFCLKSPSTGIQRAYLDQFIPLKGRLLSHGRRLFNRFKLLLPGTRRKLFSREEQLLGEATNYKSFLAFVDSLSVDAVFTVSPFHRQEDLLLRACKARGKQMITSILSFDNITKRGWIPVLYDVYLLWNASNRAQLNRIYPNTKKQLVRVTGAAQFDFYFRPGYILPEEEWRILAGLPPKDDRKIILYAGGPGNLFPNEPQYLLHIDEAIRSGRIKGNPLILFRCHPTDIVARWTAAAGDSPNIVVDHSWTGEGIVYHANIRDMDIKKLCSTLRYTDVHVNLCSTMTVDGSSFDKPQIGPAYDEAEPSRQALLQAMYRQEHFTAITSSGGLHLATSREILINQVNEALQHPGAFSNARTSILEQVITYTDGRSSERVAEAIQTALAGGYAPVGEKAPGK